MSFLEKAWTEREEQRYGEIFGPMGSGIYPLESQLFTENFQQESIDPRWLSYGVFCSPPNEKHESWLYISSGMSNPWETDEKEEFSGFGMEFVMECEKQSDWAINVLRNLVAYNILLAHGRFGDRPLIDFGDRIPFGIARADGSEGLSHLIIIQATHYQNSFELISGKVDLLHVLGVTKDEWAYAKEHGTSALHQELVTHKVYPITNRDRDSAPLS